MTYLMLICVAENVQLTSEETAAIGPATDAWVAEMDGQGVRREGAPLRPVREAAVVRIRDGEVLVSDGPFAETKEQIAGYDVVECSSLDEAIEVAAKHPVARFGAVEVRAFNPGGWWRSADRRGPGDGPEYLMIHYVDETAPLDPADDCEVPGSAAARAQQAWDDETYARGLKLAGGRLQPASAARTVRVREGAVLVTDGPFAETKEQVAGFNVLACPSLAEAVEIASQHPTARFGTLELRPFAQE
ncbi:MAG TPA: YciI family protein [Streptosporangiaceae bacterium]|nr:YciI family protein [Streptosporangiaceae bacterium]